MPQPHPLVSVIVPVFNDQPGAQACLSALARQTYPLDRIEVVLVDNGSTPPINITGVLQLRYRIEHCETPGSYAARNVGAAVASGEVFAFTDADCTPDPEWIENGVRTLLRGSGRYVVGGEVRISTPSTRSGTALYQYAAGFQQRENIEQKGFSATANLYCLASQFKDIGRFDQRLLSGADLEWGWRAAKQGVPTVFEPDAIVLTPPRATLRSAIRQARRVAAGRRHLVEHGLARRGDNGLAPHRSVIGRFTWILSRSNFSLWERMRILAAALVIKAASLLEVLRLNSGGRAERR